MGTTALSPEALLERLVSPQVPARYYQMREAEEELAALKGSNVEHNRRPQGVRVDGPVGPQDKEET